MLIIMFFVLGCEPPNNPGPPADMGRFKVLDVINRQQYLIDADLQAENAETQIYVERGQSVSESTLDAILHEFVSKALPIVRSTFGPIPDLNEDGKVILLLHDIRGNGEDSPYVLGYFNPNDLLRNS